MDFVTNHTNFVWGDILQSLKYSYPYEAILFFSLSPTENYSWATLKSLYYWNEQCWYNSLVKAIKSILEYLIPRTQTKGWKWKIMNMWLIRKIAIIDLTAVTIECRSEITISLFYPLENTLWRYLTDPTNFCTQLVC